MAFNRWTFSRTLVAGGSVLLGLGVLLLLMKLVMFLAWYESGAIAAVGLVMLVVGRLIGRGRSY